jgi:hypothetical protein
MVCVISRQWTVVYFQPVSNKNLFATAAVMSLVIAEFVIVIGEYAFLLLGCLLMGHPKHMSQKRNSCRILSSSNLADAPFFSVKLIFFTQVPELKHLSMAVNAVAAAGDVLITVFLCAFLQRSRTGFHQSDNLINRLMLFTINTGLLTSVCAVMSLISVCKISQMARNSVPDSHAVQIIVWPDAFIYVAFYFCLGRRTYNVANNAVYELNVMFSVYCNSLLATLNVRKTIRHDSSDEPMALSLHRARRPVDSPSSSARMVSTMNLHNVLLTCLQGMPNDISIKITTQEYIEDEVSYVLYQRCDLVLTCTYASFYLQRISKALDQSNRCVDEDHNIPISYLTPRRVSTLCFFFDTARKFCCYILHTFLVYLSAQFIKRDSTYTRQFHYPI